MPATLDIGALLLSGGNSTRMGFPKAFLRQNGQTLCEKLLSAYLEAGVSRPVLVLNARLCNSDWRRSADAVKNRTLLVKNDFPERGRSYSLKIGLEKISTQTGCFIHNIDNPGLDANLIHNMVQALKPKAYVVPVYQGQSGHPVLIGATPLQHLRQLRSRDWILKDELKHFEKITVDAGQTNVLYNLNTMHDWLDFLISQKKLEPLF